MIECELLAPKDAGSILGLTTSGVIRLARSGRLPELRDRSGRRLFRLLDVECLAADRHSRALRKHLQVESRRGAPRDTAAKSKSLR